MESGGVQRTNGGQTNQTEDDDENGQQTAILFIDNYNYELAHFITQTHTHTHACACQHTFTAPSPNRRVLKFAAAQLAGAVFRFK